MNSVLVVCGILYHTRHRKGHHLQEDKKNISTTKDTKQIRILCILTATILEIAQSHTLINDMPTSPIPVLVSH